MHNQALLTVLFFLSYAQCAISQGSTEIDKYLQLVAENRLVEDPIERDTLVLWNYASICEEMARVQDPRTLAYLDTLTKMSLASKWPTARGFYYRAYGRYHDFRGETTQALDYYDKAIKALEANNGNTAQIAFTYVLKGFLLSNSGFHLECRKVLKQGMPYAQKTHLKNSLCLMIDWMGDYYYYGVNDTVDYNKALFYYKQVEEILPQISYQRIIADNHAVLSGCYNNLGDKEKADYHFIMADSISKKHNLDFVRSALYSDKGDFLTEMNRHHEAHAFFKKAYDIGKGSKHIEFRSRREHDMWRSYKNIGNFEMAFHHYEEWNWMEDSLANQEVGLKYAELESQYQLAQKENEIAKLEKQRLTTQSRLFSALGLISVISLIVIVFKNRSIKRSKLDLIKAHQEAEEAIYKGETKERARIASELHDGVNSKIAAIKWQLESLPEEHQTKTISSAISMIESTYQDVRQISHNLVPKELQNLGLVNAVSKIVQTLNTKNEVNFEVISSEKPASSLKAKAYPIYNIILELINNVIRHSKAKEAAIIINQLRESLSVTVEDNGIGFDKVNDPEGFGITSIKERVKTLGGTMKIDSESGVGTKVNILIPTKAQA